MVKLTDLIKIKKLIGFGLKDTPYQRGIIL